MLIYTLKVHVLIIHSAFMSWPSLCLGYLNHIRTIQVQGTKRIMVMLVEDKRVPIEDYNIVILSLICNMSFFRLLEQDGLHLAMYCLRI